MEGHIKDIHAQYKVDKLHKAPANDDLFKVSYNSPELNSDKRERASTS